MASHTTPTEVVLAFIERRTPAARIASLQTGDDTVYSYGPHFPLVRRVAGEDGERYFLNVSPFILSNGRKSTVTSRQCSAASMALAMAGYDTTGEDVTGEDGFTWHEYVKHPAPESDENIRPWCTHMLTRHREKMEKRRRGVRVVAW